MLHLLLTPHACVVKSEANRVVYCSCLGTG
jgi:hypothetical protein